MKLFTIFLTFPSIVFSAVFFLMPVLVNADAGLINVTFESTPLFSDSDMKPGHLVTRSFTVTNLSEDPQDVYLELINCAQTKNLDEVLFMRIKEESTTLLDTPLSDLFCESPKPLTSALHAFETVTYIVTVGFAESAGDAYQSGTADFDFCVGFSGGAFGCDGSTEPEDGDGGGGTITPMSSGGSDDRPSSGGRRRLTIFNERPESVDNPSGSADLMWNTNLPATSKAVCRPSGTSVVFDLGDTDDFGYPILLPEDPALLETHLLEMNGLAPGTYYCRVASRLGPGQGWTVSDEFPFVIRAGISETGSVPSPFGFTPANVFAAGGTGTPGAGSRGDTGETQSDAEESAEPDTTDTDNETQTAAAFLALPELADLFNFGVCGDEWWIWIVVGLVLFASTLWRERFIYAIGIVLEIVYRFWIFTGVGLVAVLIAYTFSLTSFYVPLIIGSVALLIAGGVDLFLKNSALPVRRLFYTSGAIVGTLFIALLLALFIPWLCSVLPLVILTLVMLARFLWHWFRMSKKDA